MEDGNSTPYTMFESPSDNSMDFSLINELLYDGFWLETADQSNFWQPSPSTSSALNPPLYFPSLVTDLTHLNPYPNHNISEAETDKLKFSKNLPLVDRPMEDFAQSQTQNQEAATSLGQSESIVVEGSEMNRRLWVAPCRNPSPHATLRTKLVQAIEYLKESTKDKDVLVQIWVPIRKGGKHVLTTKNQPFSLDPCSKSLSHYRDVSCSYQFAAEEGSMELAGLPGRVFLKKLPEWTPDVRFFRREEYPRVSYAQHYNVSGSLALPVFERGSGTCLGVVELVTTTQKANYGPELENVCKALKAVNLRSSEVLSPPKIKGLDSSYHAAVTEILEVLKSVCDTHRLPLAQTWAPCIQQGKDGCRHSDENYVSCVSTVDSACYVLDPQVLGFHDACSEHHLLKGEGVAGGAFVTNQPCFTADVTAFSKAEYPLSHYARMFGLGAVVAIRLRTFYTGSADFVLEFFLPLDCRNTEKQKQILSLLSSQIQQVSQSLRVVTDEELAEEVAFQQGQLIAPSGSGLDKKNTPKLASSASKELSLDGSSWVELMMEPQPKDRVVAVSLGYHKEELEEEFTVTTQWDDTEHEFHHGRAFLEHNQILQYSGSHVRAESGGEIPSEIGHRSSSVKTTGEKRRTKMEKTISLQVLQQHFAGSLKDAAKSIGVCPTTLKRICRQHGIMRWPSRKIKKVGHSLRKLQLVIDSVQGVEGAIKLSSFYDKFPELSSSSLNVATPFSTSKVNDYIKQVNTQPEGNSLSPGTTASKSASSSYSHSSGSSFCCSTGAKQLPVNPNASGGVDALSAERPSEVLKKASSDADLQGLAQEGKLLMRSYSHRLLNEYASLEAWPSLPKHNGHILQDRDTFRVKATFGEEKIRFSMQQHCVFSDLQREVLRRFSMEDSSKIDLKYLDDDLEWVLLTCDADLEECIDIYRSAGSRTIKLLLHEAKLRNSFGSSTPS